MGILNMPKLNTIERWIIHQWIRKHKEDKMFQLIWALVAWLLKNIALLIGILEALVKAIVGIISLTPTKRDDKLLPHVDKVFSAIKKFLYSLAEFMIGKK